MEGYLRKIGEKIAGSKMEISQIGRRLRAEEFPEEADRMRAPLKSLTPEETVQFVTDFYVYLGEALYVDYDLSFKRVSEWGTMAGLIAIKENFPLEDSLDNVRFSRKAIWEVIKQEIREKDVPAEVIAEIASIIDPLLDRCIFCYSLAYVHQNKREMQLAQEAILELSVPVVPVAEGVAVLPIVGGIDTHRSKLLMETALKRSVELQLQRLLIDLSGVPVIDTMVAQNLFQVVNALRLLGVKTTLTGIRPELAQTVVSLGIDFDEVSTVASLQQALAMIGFDKINNK